MLASNAYASFEEYIELRKKNDAIIEYIDGIIYMSPSPSTKHQRISGRLNTKFMLYLEGKGVLVKYFRLHMI